VTAPPRGHHVPLSPLERLVEEFVTTTVPCPVCRVPTGWDCAGLVCRPRRIAALEHFLGGQRC
jgi:hypothetical protein